MKRFFAVLTALIMIFTLFSAAALAAETESTSVTDRADDPASYDTEEGLKVQRYIIIGLIALGLVTVIVMVIKNYISGR